MDHGRARSISGGLIAVQVKTSLALLLLCVIVTGCSHRPAPVYDRTGSARIGTSDGPIYTVRRGDTLYSIAFGAGLDYREVAAWNRIATPYRIYPGQKIRLVAPPTRSRPSRSTRKAPKTPQKTDNPVNSWVWPAQGQVVRAFSANRQQTGIDIAGQRGQGVFAAAPGRIVYAGSGLRGYGKLIIVKHNEVFLSAYAHNRKILAREGIRVAAGQRIAEMGDTGTDRVKLHFEIRKDGRPVNPIHYLPKQ